MDIREFKDLFFEKALKQGIEECEIFWQKSDSTKVNVYNGKLEKYDSSSCGGLGLRGIYKGKMGYCYSETISAEVIDKLIDDIKQNAEIITSADKFFIYKGSDHYSQVDVYNPKLSDLTFDEMLSAALDMEKAAYSADSRITGVNRAMTAKGETQVFIGNTKGLELSEKSNYILAYCEVMAEENGNAKENGEIWIGRDFARLNPKEIGSKAALKVLESLGGKSVESGKWDIIIKNEVMADILECFEGNFYAENVQKGFSLLKGKKGKLVAAAKITVADEPLLEDGYNSTAFDCEGVASYNKNIIENGVLKTFLYNLKSAGVDSVESTGNGFKSSFKGTVGTQATNLYIKNGEADFDDLVKKLDRGIIITEVQGLHAGANSITGDFSLAAEGFIVKDGKREAPVEQITVAGNFYTLLAEAEELGNDLKFNSSSVGSPSILFRNMSVSGL